MSVDPGGHVAWAEWEGATLIGVDQVDNCVLWETAIPKMRRLALYVVESGCGELVVEDFLLRPDEEVKSYGREALSPVSTTGLLLGGLECLGWSGKVRMYSAADAKSTYDDHRLLRAIGEKWFGRLNSTHKRDAVRHGLLNVKRHNLV